MVFYRPVKIFFTIKGWSPVGEFLPPSKLKPKPEPSLDNITLVKGPKTRLLTTSKSIKDMSRVI